MATNIVSDLRCAVCYTDLDAGCQFIPYDINADCVRYVKCSTCTAVVCNHCILKMNEAKLTFSIFQAITTTTPASCSFPFPCVVNGHHLFDAVTTNPYKVEFKRHTMVRSQLNYVVFTKFMMTLARLTLLLSMVKLGIEGLMGGFFETIDDFYTQTDDMIWTMVKIRFIIESAIMLSVWLGGVAELLIPVHTSSDPSQRDGELLCHFDAQALYGTGGDSLAGLIIDTNAQAFLLYACKFFLHDEYALINQPLSAVGLITILITILGCVLKAEYVQLVRLWRKVISMVLFEMLFEFTLICTRFGTGWALSSYLIIFFASRVLMHYRLLQVLPHGFWHHPQITAYLCFAKPTNAAPASDTMPQDHTEQ